MSIKSIYICSIGMDYRNMIGFCIGASKIRFSTYDRLIQSETGRGEQGEQCSIVAFSSPQNKAAFRRGLCSMLCYCSTVSSRLSAFSAKAAASSRSASSFWSISSNLHCIIRVRGSSSSVSNRAKAAM